MPSKFAILSIPLAALVVLLMGAPAFAQSLAPSSLDPFSNVPAVDSDEMSAVSGELAGAVNAGVPVNIGTDNRGAGAQTGGGVPSNAVRTTTSDLSASGSHDFASQGNTTVTITNYSYGGAGGSQQ